NSVIEIVDLFYNPKSVAVIGASKVPMKGGNRIVNNLYSNGYKGLIFPVNPNYNEEDEICGFKFYNSVLDIEGEVDLAIFYVNNRIVTDTLKDCVNKGIKAAIIQSAGFEEVGLEGLKLKDEITAITENFSKLRIIGPNCMGISRFDGDYDDKKGGFFTGQFILTNYKRGNVAIITQSGFLNGGIAPLIFRQYPNLGFRYIVSIGNKMDLGENEFLEYILKDDTVNVIAIYLESFKEPRKFISLCRKAKQTPKKTIILVKGGKTSQGMKAASSHTGALAEDERLIDAIIKQAGVIQANNFFEMFQFLRTFSMMYKSGKKLPTKGNIALVVGSGGMGTVMGDVAMKHGLKFPEFGENSYNILKSVFPDWMPPNRFALVDSWPTMEKAMMRAAKKTKISIKESNEKTTIIEKKRNPFRMMNSFGNVMEVIQKAVLEEPKIEGLFTSIPGSPRGSNGTLDYMTPMLERIAKYPKPVFFYSVMESESALEMLRLCGKFNIPLFTRTEDIAKNFAILVQETKNKEKFLKTS
ncbi:MAG: CoA-binding protein, partial [Candidatus Thorarchaeota archaeon]